MLVKANITPKNRLKLKQIGLDLMPESPYFYLPQDGKYWVSDDFEAELPCKFICGLSQDFQIGAYSYCRSLVGKAKIGRYCSISVNVTIGFLDKHPTNWLSTSPIQYQQNFMNCKNLSIINKFRSTEKTIIGNDVWIGWGATIKDGVKIGNGAIIGCSSLVLKDVPAYAIVVGNPARIIRYRFSEEIIERLEKLKWWEYDICDFKNIDFENFNEEKLNNLEIMVAKLQKFSPRKLVQKDFLPFESTSKKFKRFFNFENKY
jgi:acetyltransferase-like isoleucine patch superfamily enzyme